MADYNKVTGTRARSILQEISMHVPSRNQEEVIEMRGHHVVTAAINLLEMIECKYTEEEAELLTKRLVSAIRTKDIKKFERSIRKIKEDRNAK